MAGFAASLVVALVINAAYAGIYPGWQFFYLIPALVIQTMFNFGLAALFGRLAVVVADLTNIIPYALRIWLYMSPIIWPLSFFEQAPEQIQNILRLNPMFGIIGMYRSALLGYPIEMSHLLTSLAWAVAVVVTGVTIFVRSERTMMRGQ
jgi:teichoic acid transport system permease protein